MREAFADTELTKLKTDQRKKKQSDIKTRENDIANTDFNWKSLYKERKIGSLTVAKLDIYLKEKNLLPEGCIAKEEKVALVETDLAPATWPKLLWVKCIII